jgi:uncharacterized delta-60 repeat protein
MTRRCDITARWFSVAPVPARVFALAVLLTFVPWGARPATLGGVPEGELDVSFSGDGKLLIDPPLAGSYSVSTVLEGPDGALVVTGLNAGSSAWFWIRIAPDGTTSFCAFIPPGATGITGRPPATFDGAGRLLVAGGVEEGSAVVGGVARFLYPGCLPDVTFGNAGYQRIDATPAAEILSAIASDPRDPLRRIFLAGMYLAPTLADTVFFSLHENGALRAGEFGPNGWVRVDLLLLQRIELPTALEILPSGKVLAAGLLGAEGAAPSEIYLQRMNPDGTRDATFGVSIEPGDEGGVRLGLPPDDLSAVDFAVEPASGRLAIVGQRTPDPGDPEGVVALLHADGLPDETIGPDGLHSFSFPGQSYTSLVGVEWDGLGRILVGATVRTSTSGSDYEFAVARLADDGELDVTFGTGGATAVPFDVGNPPADRASAFLLHGGRPVVAGNIYDTDDLYTPAVIRLTAALVFADAFEGGDTRAWSAATP